MVAQQAAITRQAAIDLRQQSTTSDMAIDLQCVVMDEILRGRVQLPADERRPSPEQLREALATIADLL